MTFKKLHPYQINFCGYSGSGKTTLISKIIKICKEKSVAYVKTDAHGFQMDTPGKDTYTAWQSGACQVAITDSEHSAIISTAKEIDGSAFLDCDIVLAEGGKGSSSPKIVVLDRSHKIMDEVASGRITNILAYIGQNKPKNTGGIPYFDRDDVEKIWQFIENYFLSEKIPPVYGLVLAGGLSTRMRRDKAMIDYHGTPQFLHCYSLLEENKLKSFVSTRLDQRLDADIPQINDRLLEFGPIGGILSAMLTFPDVAWLVVACDLPLLNSKTIELLLSNRDIYKMAAYFKAHESELPEPLCAIYEPKSRYKLMGALAAGVRCPRKILLQSPCKALKPLNENQLLNVNSFSEYQKIKSEIFGEYYDYKRKIFCSSQRAVKEG